MSCTPLTPKLSLYSSSTASPTFPPSFVIKRVMLLVQLLVLFRVRHYHRLYFQWWMLIGLCSRFLHEIDFDSLPSQVSFQSNSSANTPGNNSNSTNPTLNPSASMPNFNGSSSFRIHHPHPRARMMHSLEIFTLFIITLTMAVTVIMIHLHHYSKGNRDSQIPTLKNLKSIVKIQIFWHELMLDDNL